MVDQREGIFPELNGYFSKRNLFSARLTTSRAMASSSIFNVFSVTRSVCSLAVLKLKGLCFWLELNRWYAP